MRTSSLHPCFGVGISGVTPEQLAQAEFVDSLLQTVHEHGFVLLRGIGLNADSAMALARLLGNPEQGYRPEFTHRAYPELALLGNVGEVDGGVTYLNTQGIEWHTDATGKGLTPGVTMLYCLKTPKDAGDTLFASTDAAYAAMDEERLSNYRELEVVHSFNIHNDKVASFPGTNVSVQQAVLRNRYPDTTDSVVATHPHTNRPCFFISHQLVKEVVGYGHNEGMDLVMDLVRHITQEQFVFRHRWKKQDLIVFDNRSCLHSATDYDYQDQDRLFYQIIIAGHDDDAQINRR
tara:strand:- start:80 stop:952 length:873 start_codon:yes stop_codon:yes gene_type:complete